MFAFVKADFLKSIVGTVAKSNDHKTTLLGALAASIMMGTQVDWGKLVNGDSSEIGKVVGAVIVGLIGYLTNKKDKSDLSKG